VTNSLSLSLSLSRFVRGRRPERERDGGQKTKREREREEQIKEFFFFIFIFPLFFSPLSPLKISLLKIEKSFVSLVLRNDENDKDNNDGWIGGAKQREESAIENVAEQEGAFEVRKSCCLIVFEKGVNSTDTLSQTVFFYFFSLLLLRKILLRYETVLVFCLLFASTHHQNHRHRWSSFVDILSQIKTTTTERAHSFAVSPCSRF